MTKQIWMIHKPGFSFREVANYSILLSQYFQVYWYIHLQRMWQYYLCLFNYCFLWKANNNHWWCMLFFQSCIHAHHHLLWKPSHIDFIHDHFERSQPVADLLSRTFTFYTLVRCDSVRHRQCPMLRNNVLLCGRPVASHKQSLSRVHFRSLSRRFHYSTHLRFLHWCNADDFDLRHYDSQCLLYHLFNDFAHN